MRSTKWNSIRDDVLAGMTFATAAKKYGVSVGSIRNKASRDKWSVKLAREYRANPGKRDESKAREMLALDEGRLLHVARTAISAGVTPSQLIYRFKNDIAKVSELVSLTVDALSEHMAVNGRDHKTTIEITNGITKAVAAMNTIVDVSTKVWGMDEGDFKRDRMPVVNINASQDPEEAYNHARKGGDVEL